MRALALCRGHCLTKSGTIENPGKSLENADTSDAAPGEAAGHPLLVRVYFLAAREYMSAPKMARPEPRAPSGVMPVWKTTKDARMMTTRLTVLVTACVTGETSESAMKATSLYM
mmetsp:Transcript_100661/g.259914  ORF Transcript_100661/g.259914 Transcript_100661/m.259914 type:complete len:114 (-) Transcript_100661:1060-1401(-)